MNNVHRGQRLYTLGKPLPEAAGAVVMIHGRGADARSILELVPALKHPDWAFLAPQAAGGAWYPYRFMEPLERNVPYLGWALETVSDVLAQIAASGIPPEKTVLLGFSQGACLATEYAARNAQRYGGIVGLSGGLIGPEGTQWPYPAKLDGTPVLLGCSDVDFHIPVTRVHETAQVLKALGGVVDERIYPNMDHTINDDEIQAVQALLDGIAH